MSTWWSASLFRCRLTPALVARWAAVQRLGAPWRGAPPALPLLTDAVPATTLPATASSSSSGSLSSLADALWDGLLLMAVPKKRVSYTRKRKRIAGVQAVRGPKLQPHLYMCPVCERMRAPHRVCDRQDCSTYYVNKWF